MPLDWTLVLVLVVLFVATVIRTAFGFGEALIAVPLLAMVLPIEVATPVAVLVSITVALAILAQDWRKVQLRSAGWLIVSTLFGIPLGLWLLTAVAELIVKSILAVVIIAFSGYCLIRKTPIELKDDRLAWGFGFVAGVLGGAYGMNGPPLVIYGALRRWSPEFFRATLQGYFLPASVIGMIGYWLAGLWVIEVTYYFLMSLPVVIVAILVGRVIHQRLKDQPFLVYVHVALIAVGVMLLSQTLWQHLRGVTSRVNG